MLLALLQSVCPPHAYMGSYFYINHYAIPRGTIVAAVPRSKIYVVGGVKTTFLDRSQNSKTTDAMDEKFRRPLFRPQYRKNDEKKRSVPPGVL